MMLDNLNLFSDKQKIRGEVDSTNVIKLFNSIGERVARGSSKGDSEIFLLVNEKFEGANKMTVRLATASKKDKSDETILQTAHVSNLAPGKEIVPFGTLPSGVQEYVYLKFAPDGTVTAGAVTAGLSVSKDQNRI